ncbi:MAG: glycine cleavage system protein H, partial [Prochlorococcus sp.]
EELQNDPHGEGWLLVIRPKQADQLDELMDAATYASKVAAM